MSTANSHIDARPEVETPTLRVVAAALVENGSCFVAQRGAAASHNPLKWELPGGKIEPGESPRDALRRELREELELEVEVGAWLVGGRHRSQQHILQLDVYRVRRLGGRIRLTEHVAASWVEPMALKALDWSEADRILLPGLIQRIDIAGSASILHK